MHVLMTVNSAWNIWNFRRPLAEALVRDGHRITVLAPADDSVPALKQIGCSFTPLEMSATGLNPLRDYFMTRRLKRVFESLRPDVILSFTIKNNIMGALAARSAGVPIIPTVTGLGTAFLTGGFLRRLTETLYRRSFVHLPVVVFQNEDDRDLFLSRRLVRPFQTRILPGSGIDLERFRIADYPPEAESPTFLMISRLLRDKGVYDFVEAARLVKAQEPGACFQLLGPIDPRSRGSIDAREVARWEQEGVVEYLGSSCDVRPFISASHCIVLPSYREGAPRVLIEGAAMGRPLIATDVPGCRQVVDHKITGFLVKARESDVLASACLKFLDLPHAAKRNMGLEGRRKVQRDFDASVVVSGYREAISALRSG